MIDLQIIVFVKNQHHFIWVSKDLIVCIENDMKLI